MRSGGSGGSCRGQALLTSGGGGISARDEILGALGTSGQKEIVGAPPGLRHAAPATIDGLWEQFWERLSVLGGQEMDMDEVLSLPGRVWCDPDAGSFVSAAQFDIVDDVWDAEICITLADCAVSETGSLLINNGPDRSRLASLAPRTHVALVLRQAIVGTLEQAVALLDDRNAVLITGPSRTADIEGQLVRGVHGPGELFVAVLEG